MDRTRAFPHFDPSRIVLDDGIVLAIDKPPFVPSQAANPEAPDDVVTRLERLFPGAKLGVHQRLDKDTSGLMIFARDPSANATLAREIEGRHAVKRYVAAVEGWKRDRATLVHHLAPGPDGTMRVARDGKKAITKVRVIERHRERALLELVLETGRTHQARVQLAREGAPIAGDVLYGGPRAPRLMLHACGLEIAHPNGKRLSLESKTPSEMLDWVHHREKISLERLVDWARTKRYALAHDPNTNAFRVMHEDGDGVPGVAVDLYDRWLVVQIHEGTDVDRDALLDALAMLDADGIYLKMRPRGPVPPDVRALAPPDPVRGSPAPSPLFVREANMEIGVRLGEGLATGLYLDQRRNRARVRAESANKRVLNLFSYTCAFTVAAALGGARSSVSVDSSMSALERGRENLARNSCDLRAHEFVMDDAQRFLQRAARKNERFDIIILDPPSFGRARGAKFSSGSDYGSLARACLELLSPDGILLACTNHRKTSRDQLRKILHDAARAAGRSVLQMKDLAPPPDFSGAEVTMKSVWLRLDPKR